MNRSALLGKSATHPVVTKAATDQIEEWCRVSQAESDAARPPCLIPAMQGLAILHRISVATP